KSIFNYVRDARGSTRTRPNSPSGSGRLDRNPVPLLHQIGTREVRSRLLSRRARVPLATGCESHGRRVTGQEGGGDGRGERHRPRDGECLSGGGRAGPRQRYRWESLAGISGGTAGGGNDAGRCG